MTPAKCRIIKETCIPLAYDFYRFKQSGYDEDLDFWAKLKEQGVELYPAGSSMFLCTADGRVLKGSDDTWRGLDNGLAAWEALPEDHRKPGAMKIEDRGRFDPQKGLRQLPPGGLALRLCNRIVQRDGKGNLCVPEKFKRLLTGVTTRLEANLDYHWLLPDEVGALMPANPKLGDKFQVPAVTRDRFFILGLIDRIDYTWAAPWKKQDVHNPAMTLQVQEVTPNQVRLRLEGSVLLATDLDLHRSGTMTRGNRSCDARWFGTLAYNPQKKVLTDIRIVAIGDYRGYVHGTLNGAPEQPFQFGIAVLFEHAGQAPTDKLPPAFARPPHGTSLEAYWRIGQ